MPPRKFKRTKHHARSDAQPSRSAAAATKHTKDPPAYRRISTPQPDPSQSQSLPAAEPAAEPATKARRPAARPLKKRLF